MSKGKRVRAVRLAKRLGLIVPGRQHGTGATPAGKPRSKSKAGTSLELPTARQTRREAGHPQSAVALHHDAQRVPWRRPRDSEGRKMKSADVRSYTRYLDQTNLYILGEMERDEP